jgi:predicted secreted hydrolase
MTPLPNIALRVVMFLTLALTFSACAAEPEAGRVRSSVAEAMARGDDLPFAQPLEPREFTFPDDHGPHEEYRTEWWYYTGNLWDEAGNPYGYQLTFFRNAITPDEPQRASELATNDIYMAHFAVTDGADNQHYSFDRYSRGAGGLAGATGEPVYSVWLEDWRVEQIEPGVVRMVATAGTGTDGEEESTPVAIDLTLRETRAPILHGKQGLSPKGPERGNASYYYSLVQVATDGMLTIGDDVRSVGGLSWMDHEFGTSVLTEGVRGWDWFSVQLENDAILMFAEFHDGAGGNRSAPEGTLVYPDGRQVSLNDGDFELRAIGEWTSSRTGITYPHGWEARFPEANIELTIMPMIEDQEMDVDFVYYEGATEIAGSMAGEQIEGIGFVELTGYGERELAEFQR